MSNPFRLSIEQEMLRSLHGLIHDVYGRGELNAARRLPTIAYRVASAAVDRRSAALLDQAADLWLAEIALIEELPSPASQQSVADLVAEMAYYSIAHLASELENDFLPMSRRLSAVPLLNQLARFQAQALRLHADRGDVDAYKATWQRWVRGPLRNWTPEYDAEEAGLSISGVQASETEISRLRSLSELAEAKVFVLRSRAHYWALVGAWIVHRYRADKIPAAEFEAMVPYVVGVFSSTEELLAELDDAAHGEWDIELLNRWDLSTWDTRGGAQARFSAAEPAVDFWLMLLLARMLPAGPPREDLSRGLPESVVSRWTTALEEIGATWPRWSTVLDDPERVMHAQEWLQRQRSRAQAQAEAALAEAKPDTELVRAFIDGQQHAFETRPLRQILRQVGALEIQVTSSTIRREPPELMLKAIFVPGEVHFSLDDALATRFAQREEHAIYRKLAETGTPAKSSADEAGAAIADLALASASDAVLIPDRFELRSLLDTQPEFEWSYAPPVAAGPTPLGHLAGIPVYDVGPEDGEELIVVSFARAVKLVEKRRPNETSSLQIQVVEIDARRASELYEANVRFSDLGDEAEPTIAALTRWRVELVISFEFSLTVLSSVGEAAVRFPIRT